jgi:hypothetical protein
MPNGLPFLIPLAFVMFSVAHLFSFSCCVMYVCLSSYCVLCLSVRRQANKHNTQYKDKQTYTIQSTTTSIQTQYTVRRQKHIHNTKYDDKQTNTIHSTKTNKQYCVLCLFACRRTVSCVCLLVFVLCIVYVSLSSYCVLFMFAFLRTMYCVCLFVLVLCIVYVCLSSYCVLCMFVCLRTV